MTNKYINPFTPHSSKIFNVKLNNEDVYVNKNGYSLNIKIRDNLYNSYDFLLNEKYKIKVNENSLDRMKNYFR